MFFFKSNFDKKMEILLRIKKSPPILPDYQYLVNSCQQLQLIYFLILNQKITFYQDILDLFPSNYLNHIRQIFILATFGFNIITLTYFIIKALLFSQNSSKFEKNYFQFFRIKPQLLFVIIINANVGQLFYWNKSLLLTVGAIFNIGFALGQVAACQLVNVSYRFVEKNGIYRRNASILPWIMLVVILISIRLDNFMYTALAIILRALLIIITNFRSSQAQSTSYIEYLFAFLQLSLTLFLLFSNTVSNNPFLCTFIFLLCFYSSHCLSSSLKLTLPKYYINNSHELLVSSSQQMEIEQDFGQNDEIVQRTLRVVRLWIDVYKLREVCINEEKWRHSHNQGKGYDLWWLQFNRAIIFHRVNCSNPTCKCQSINRTNPQLQPTINQLFIQLLKAKISSLQNISLVKNYFLIQILNKPFQAYYQLTKLHNKNVNDKKLLRKKELLELKIMVDEVRQMLSGILLKQRVANHQLNIEPIVEFQTHLKNMKNNLTYLTNHYCKFYTLFTKTLIPFSQIKALTSSLNKIKSQFNTQVSSYIDKFFHNVQFISICLLYEKYFDQYSQKISNRKEKLQIFNFSHRQSDQQIITDPQYGVVQIDLVNQVGKIIGFTKNIAKLLGYAIHDVTGQKVNKLMPHMFAKHHDKFLKNFVQRGSIKNLKIKQMAFYSRNSSKFIVPVTARIKVSYNIDGSFSALALIRKTPTKSDFILVSNSGKIQEMSQHLYDKLFRKLFNSDTFKLRRLCIYKMILALNHFINSEKQEHDEKIYQGTFMISNDENNMFKWFKPVDGQRNFEKNDKLESAFNTIMSKSSFTSFRSSNGTSATLTQESQDIAKKVSDLKESFKEYFQLIDLDQIRAFRIRFKFEDLVTAQFRCKVLEVVQICEELPQNLISLQLSKQLSEIGQLYGLQLSQTQKFRKYKHKSLENLQMPSTQQKQLKSETCSQHSSLNLSVYQNARTQKFENKNDIIGQGSVTSSLNSQSQKNQKKQAIISSFEQKNSISDTFYKALSLIQILTTLTLIIICFFSIRLQSDYVELQQDNLIISNFKVNFEFRLAVQQMYHFYHPFDLQPPQFLVSKKHILTDSMKLQLQNSIKWISDKLSYQLYFKEMTIVWADSGFQEKRNVLSVLGMIYSMFLMTQQLGQHLSDNYPLLIENLNALAQKEEEIVHMQSQNFQNKIHAVIAFYIAFLIILICIFIYINYKTVQTQTKIVDFLPFININSIHKKLQFYQKVSDHLKQAQQVIFQQIDQIPLTINNIAQQQRISSPKSPTAPKSLSKLPLKLVGNLSDSAPATTNNPRFLRIIRDHQTYFTFKNVMFGFVLIVVFGLVVWETEYFFYEGHHKFQAYLDLKQSAMIVQNIPSRLILLYFINTDKILHQQDIVIFPEDLYEIAHDKKFDLRYHLSRTDINGTELAQSLNYHFNTQICQLIECQNPSHIVQQEDIYYLAYRFNDAFEYLRKVNKTLPLSNSPKEELMRWLQEGNILEVFKGVQHILQLMKINQHEISNLFTQQINRIGYILLFFSLTLIPLLIFVMLFVKNKFIKYANGRLQDAQHIFKQFSWDILSENMYAINYFETKLKKAVKG